MSADVAQSLKNFEFLVWIYPKWVYPLKRILQYLAWGRRVQELVHVGLPTGVNCLIVEKIAFLSTRFRNE